MIFASPDFGAAATAMLVIGVVALVVCALDLAVFLAGVRRLKAASKKTRVGGGVLIFLGIMVPLGCCFGPEQLFRIKYGSYPLGDYPNGKLEKGMTADEVIGTLGTPHQKERDENRERWLYWLDSYTLSWVSVSFEDGHVTGWGGN